MIEEKFAEKFILSDKDLADIKKTSSSLEKILIDYDKEPLKAALLLYLSQSPEAFIFEEAGLKVNFDEKFLDRSNSRPKAYLVNKVNEASFYDYLRGVLCK